jgi:hypothetical protein
MEKSVFGLVWFGGLCLNTHIVKHVVEGGCPSKSGNLQNDVAAVPETCLWLEQQATQNHGKMSMSKLDNW